MSNPTYDPATGTPVTMTNVNANGQATMANSAPVVLASDQANLPIKLPFSEQASLSAGALNADLVPSTDISAYEEWSLQVSALATGGTLTFQGSNDGTNFVSVLAYPATGSGSPVNSVSATGMWYGPRKYRFLRVRQTAWSSGTTQGTLEIYTLANYQTTQSVNAAESGTWTVQPGNTQNTTPWVVAGSNNNATQPANTAGNVVVKASPGLLVGAIVTATGTVGLSVFDNASTNSGTLLLVIPANPTVGQLFPVNGWAKLGIVSAGVTNCPAVTFFFS